MALASRHHPATIAPVLYIIQESTVKSVNYSLYMSIQRKRMQNLFELYRLGPMFKHSLLKRRLLQCDQRKKLHL